MEITCQPCLTAFPELGELASQLRCGICYEIMKIPMITSCSHSYCSLCIRTSISFKQTCPACPSVVRDDSLKNNLALHNCIAPFLSLQKKIHELCKTGAFKNLKNLAEPKTSSVSNVSPEKQFQIDPLAHAKAQESGGSRISPGTKFQTEAKKHSVATESNESKSSTESKFQAEAKHIAEWMQSPKKIPTTEHNHSPIIKRDVEPQNSSAGKLPAVFFTSPKSSSRLQNDGPSSSTQNDNVNRVSCPVCSVQIPERNINLHLDKCLSSQEDMKSPSPSKPEAPRREPLKKMVYHMMAEKEIRKKLKDYGLSTKGDRSQLISRLQKYTVLYNSECDSLHPRPVAEIKRQLEKEEEALSKLGQPLLKALRVPKTADQSEIEEINKQYINENKSAFEDLIRQVRQRGTGKEKKELPPDGVDTPKRTNTYKSNLFEQLKTMEDESSPTAARNGLYPKRSRFSDDDSDDIVNSLPSSKAAKKEIIQDDEDDDFIPSKPSNTPRRNRIYDEDFPISGASDDIEMTAVSKPTTSKLNGTRKGTATSKNLNISDHSGSDTDDEQCLNQTVFRRSESPVLNRRKSVQDDSNPVGKRTRRQRSQDTAKQPAQTVPNTRRKARQKTEVAKATKPTRRKTKCKDAPLRTVSRTPSLSPSHFEGFNESGSANERGRSETPELIFESESFCKSLLPSKTEAEPASNEENAPLSQLVGL